MRIKDLPVKTKRSSRATDWREDEAVVALRKRLRTFSKDALISFAEAKERAINLQQKRIKNSKMTYEEVMSKGMRKLVEVIAHDKAHRSNLVGVLIEVQDKLQFMQDAISIVRRKIKANYAAALKKEFGAVAVQDDAIGDHFTTTVKAIKEGLLVVKIIDLVIADIDSGGYSDNRTLRTAELIFHPARAD